MPHNNSALHFANHSRFSSSLIMMADMDFYRVYSLFERMRSIHEKIDF